MVYYYFVNFVPSPIDLLMLAKLVSTAMVILYVALDRIRNMLELIQPRTTLNQFLF
jgi:hypothetical protein